MIAMGAPVSAGFRQGWDRRPVMRYVPAPGSAEGRGAGAAWDRPSAVVSLSVAVGAAVTGRVDWHEEEDPERWDGLA